MRQHIKKYISISLRTIEWASLAEGVKFLCCFFNDFCDYVIFMTFFNFFISDLKRHYLLKSWPNPNHFFPCISLTLGAFNDPVEDLLLNVKRQRILKLVLWCASLF